MKQIFNWELVRIARESRMLTQKELCEKAQISQANYSRIEKGLQIISDDILHKISLALDYPEDFFFKNTQSTPLSLFYYRKRLSLTQKLTAKLESDFERIRIAIDYLLDSISIPECNLNDINNTDTKSPIDLARECRYYMNIPRGPIANIVEVLERNGIIVLFIEADVKFDGISIITDKNQPIIIINSILSNDRKRFTLAHELGHLLMHAGRKSIEKDSKEIEKEANQFASEFLMPINECRGELLNMKYHELNSLKIYWKISKAAILYKAEDFNCLKPSIVKSYRFRLINDGERTKEKIIVNIDEPAIIKQMLIAYREQLHYDGNEISQLTGMSTTDITELLEYKEKKKVVSLFT